MKRLNHFSVSLFFIAILLMGFVFVDRTIASTAVTAKAVPSDSTPALDKVITGAVNVDMRDAGPKLESYTAILNCDPVVLNYMGHSSGKTSLNTPTVNFRNIANRDI
jgi:hypothetical protein